jgi:hypothetical protein
VSVSKNENKTIVDIDSDIEGELLLESGEFRGSLCAMVR